MMILRTTVARTARRMTTLGLAAATILAAPAAAQISVSPIDFTLNPAGPRVGAFAVTNDSHDPQQLTLYANDWDRDAGGGNRFYPLGTLPASCRSRIQIFPQSVRVAPGASESIRISMLPGDSTQSACWTIVFAETAPAAIHAGSRIAFVTRLGVKVYVTPGSATLDATIDSMAVARHVSEQGISTADSAATQDVVALLHNTGGAPLIAKGSVEFRTLDNRSVAKVTIDDTPVLPGALRRVRVPVPTTLASGHYIALVVLGFGGADDVAGQVEVSVP
ncbi:MAG: hypothetical protein ACHQXA_02490 [Gemmatimonadales bacterium]